MSATAPVLTESRIPLAELTKTREWAELTAKQAQWVTTYLESGYDRQLATKTAFECKSDHNSKNMTYEIQQNPRVLAVLDIHFGEDATRRRVFERLQRRIERGKITVAEIEGIKFLCTARGWTPPENLPRINGYAPKKSVADSPVSALQQIPAGAQPWMRDGKVIGYRDANGRDVQL